MSESGFTRTSPTAWPSGQGEVVAMLARSPAVLEASHGLRFFEGADNLDAYDAAAIRLPSGRRVGLMRHRGNPVAGTELHADSRDDFLEAIREFLDAFELSADDLVWIRDDVPIDHLRLAEDRVAS